MAEVKKGVENMIWKLGEAGREDIIARASTGELEERKSALTTVTFANIAFNIGYLDVFGVGNKEFSRRYP